MVPWMSGLVNGLQNRLRRFESARHLRRKEKGTRNEFLLFVCVCRVDTAVCALADFSGQRHSLCALADKQQFAVLR